MIASRVPSDIMRSFGIPELEQTIESPFDAMNAGLLILESILSGERLRSDCWPVITSIEVKKVGVG